MHTGIAARWLALNLALALLAGCTGLPQGGPAAPPTPGRSGEQPTQPPPPSPPSERSSAVMPPAVRDLVSRAQDSSAAGEHERAIAYLERALRIVPRNAVIWQNLAVVRYRQGQYAQAESLALKSIALAGDNINLKHQDWMLVGEARHLQGDEAGAREARTRAAGFAATRARP